MVGVGGKWGSKIRRMKKAQTNSRHELIVEFRRSDSDPTGTNFSVQPPKD